MSILPGIESPESDGIHLTQESTSVLKRILFIFSVSWHIAGENGANMKAMPSNPEIVFSLYCISHLSKCFFNFTVKVQVIQGLI